VEVEGEKEAAVPTQSRLSLHCGSMFVRLVASPASTAPLGEAGEGEGRLSPYVDDGGRDLDEVGLAHSLPADA